MLLAGLGFLIAVAGYVFLRNAARKDGPERRARLRAALARLAQAHRLELAGDVALGTVDNVDVRLELGTHGFFFDGDMTLLMRCPEGVRFVMWPRDPPDAVVDSLIERGTGDPVFDARYAMFVAKSEATSMLDPETRRRALDLGLIAVVLRSSEAALLFPGVPSDDAFPEAVEILTRVMANIETVA